jgi:hypothetical protein
VELRPASSQFSVYQWCFGRIELLIIVHCQEIRIRQFWVLVIKRFESFLGREEIFNGLPRRVIFLLPQDEKLSAFAASLLVLALPRLQYLPHLVARHLLSRPTSALEPLR